jgi:hypothetical protein
VERERGLKGRRSGGYHGMIYAACALCVREIERRDETKRQTWLVCLAAKR